MTVMNFKGGCEEHRAACEQNQLDSLTLASVEPTALGLPAPRALDSIRASVSSARVYERLGQLQRHNFIAAKKTLAYQK